VTVGPLCFIDTWCCPVCGYLNDSSSAGCEYSNLGYCQNPRDGACAHRRALSSGPAELRVPEAWQAFVIRETVQA
jgi:hypothetical protein